jgi:uracil-DNA glycosylase family 4
MTEQLKTISSEVISCDRCSRLRKYCHSVAQTKKRSYQDEVYWGKPITGFGDPKAQMVIIGLAPAAHGANRTGRIFTGDRSGLWLYRALHKAKFANQPSYERADDGLKLADIYITCVVKCAPPDNKPLPLEVKKCSTFLERELSALVHAKVFLVLGQIALNALWPLIVSKYPEHKLSKPKLKHGELVRLPDGKAILLSYHPSQQNTFTGRLTEPMFDQVFAAARKFLAN